MYKILGSDQREYGPANADQISAWIREGRANGQTLVKAEDSADWKPLSSFPEFALVLGAQATPPKAPPPPLVETRGAEIYIARASSLEIGRCFERSWSLMTRHAGLTIGASALILVLSFAVGFIPIVGFIASTVFTLVFWGGLDWLFLKLFRGERADISDAFSGFQIGFVQLMLAGIVTTVLITLAVLICLVPGILLTVLGLGISPMLVMNKQVGLADFMVGGIGTMILICLGLILCILPMIYLSVAWLGFGPLLIMDKKMEFWPALELSRVVVTKNWWRLFGLFFLTAVLFLAGLMLCLVGVFFSLPLAVGAVVNAYEDIFGASESRAP